jgi:hypothetical protein
MHGEVQLTQAEALFDKANGLIHRTGAQIYEPLLARARARKLRLNA